MNTFKFDSTDSRQQEAMATESKQVSGQGATAPIAAAPQAAPKPLELNAVRNFTARDTAGNENMGFSGQGTTSE